MNCQIAFPFDKKGNKSIISKGKKELEKKNKKDLKIEKEHFQNKLCDFNYSKF